MNHEKMECRISLDGQPFSFPLEGEIERGSGGVLFQQLQGPFARTPYRDQGYAVIDLFSFNEYSLLQAACLRQMRRILGSIGVSVPENFKLTDYHTLANNTIHQQVITQTKLLQYADLGLDADLICQRLGQHLYCTLDTVIPDLDTAVIHLRISRPQSLDINPLHRDAYLPYYRHTVNLWIPIAGCDAYSSLPVLPGSHWWAEEDLKKTRNGEARINGLAYHVPGIVGAAEPLDLVRPNPQPGQALVFTPCLIHGAAVNQNTDTTRLSLELRLYIAD